MLLVNVKPQPTLVDISNIIRPNPVIDKVIELDVVVILSIVSTDFTTLDYNLYFFTSFLIYSFHL